MVSQNKILAPLFESLRSLGGHMGSDVTKKGVGDILPAYKLGYDIEHRTDRTQFQKVAPFSNFSSNSAAFHQQKWSFAMNPTVRKYILVKQSKPNQSGWSQSENRCNPSTNYLIKVGRDNMVWL